MATKLQQLTDDDRIESFTTDRLPKHRAQRKQNGKQEQSPHSIMMSQDDKSPSPLKPSAVKNHIATPNSPKKKGSKFQDQHAAGEDDTDFKDSALGEEEQDFTEASVNEMELSNRQLRLTADEIMAKMDSLV